MKLEEGMIIDGYVSRIVNNDNLRFHGLYYVEEISDQTIVRPVSKDGDYWVPDGNPILIGENTNSLGDWRYVQFAETIYMPNIAKTPVQINTNPLEGMSKEEIIAWIKEKLHDPTD